MASVKIKMTKNPGYTNLITIEGKRKFDKDGCLQVSPKTAHQMVDGKRWVYADPKEGEKAVADYLKNEERKKKMAEEDEESGSTSDDTSEDEEDEEDGTGDKDDEEDEESIGDEEIKATLKKLPKMKEKELKELAIDLDVEVDKGDKKATLVRKIRAKLKG